MLKLFETGAAIVLTVSLLVAFCSMPLLIFLHPRRVSDDLQWRGAVADEDDEEEPMDTYDIAKRVAQSLRKQHPSLSGIPEEQFVAWVQEYYDSCGFDLVKMEVARRLALGEYWSEFPTTTWGGGSPEGRQHAKKGSRYVRIDPGHVGEKWVKTTDDGATGWEEVET